LTSPPEKELCGGQIVFCLAPAPFNLLRGAAGIPRSTRDLACTCAFKLDSFWAAGLFPTKQKIPVSVPPQAFFQFPAVSHKITSFPRDLRNPSISSTVTASSFYFKKLGLNSFTIILASLNNVKFFVSADKTYPQPILFSKYLLKISLI